MLLLVDPDAPTPDDPKFAFWRHWVVSRLKPLTSATGIVAEGKPPLTEYLGPGPKDEYVKFEHYEPQGASLCAGCELPSLFWT
jgi:phosphatidylethanolamine-binding protein